jgi:hypothetical protein
MWAVPQLDLLITVGGNMRYTTFLELAPAAPPLITTEVVDSLSLKANTVRPQ